MTEFNIRKLPAPEPALHAFEIFGRVTKAEVEWMAEVMTETFEDQDTLDILIVMRGHDGIEAGAVLDFEVLKAQARSTLHVRRYAVVGAPDWARAMIEFFDPVSPIDARTFDVDVDVEDEDEDAAWAWVRAA